MAAKHAELMVPCDPSYLELVGQFVGYLAGRMGFPDREVARIRLAVDEACANVVSHAMHDTGGSYRVICEEGETQLTVRVQDSGPLFDLEQIADPNLDAPVEKRNVGGLGIYLMRRVMDTVEIRPCAVGKELVLTKQLAGVEGKADGH